MLAQTAADAIIEIPTFVDLSAVVAGALSGAVFAARKQFDVAGVLLVAAATGLGGGIIRDVLLNVRPVALTNDVYLPVIVGAAVVGFFFASLVGRFDPVLTLVDAISLGLFMVVGVEKSLLAGLPETSAIAVGVISATGGGVLRDLLAGDPPQLVRRGPWNAVAALVGAIVYVVLVEGFDVLRGPAELIAIAVTVVARLLSVWRGWETPVPYDLTYVVRRPIQRLRARERPIDDERGGAS